MKRLTMIILAALLLLPLSINAQELQESSTQIVLMGSAWSDDGLVRDFDAGFKFGVQMPLDLDRGLWLRVSYAEWNITGVDKSLLPDPEADPSANARSFGITMLMDWAIGKKWKFYVPVGGEMYFDGPLVDTDMFIGFGASRRILTFDKAGDMKIPAHIDGFVDITFADGSGQFSGNYIQLNLGIKIGKPVKL